MSRKAKKPSPRYRRGSKITPIRIDGVGLRFEHHSDFIDAPQDIGWLEVHSENYFTGIPRQVLRQISKTYPLSFHGVGLSLGSTDSLSQKHLEHLKSLVDEFDPLFVSEHISWVSVGSVYLNDLLPLPYTQESLNVLCHNIDKTQEFLGRQILVENPSTYIQYKHAQMSEPDFIKQVIQRTGCGLLLDVNNVYVSSKNLKQNPYDYLDQIQPNWVQEIHLAGHFTREFENKRTIIVDTHDTFVCDDVWDLYAYTIQKMGAKPTLIEWDSNLPNVKTLIGESHKARYICDNILKGRKDVQTA